MMSASVQTVLKAAGGQEKRVSIHVIFYLLFYLFIYLLHEELENLIVKFCAVLASF